MPIVSFAALPDDARLWVFAASDPVTGDRADRLLAAVDDWLTGWKAHGEALTCGRDWRDDRFLAIAVDQSTAGASGCSIDALFRVLGDLEGSLGTTLLGGGRVFFRDRLGRIVAESRQGFAARATSGEVAPSTAVFDTTITTAAAYRSSFVRNAGESWHLEFFPGVSSRESA